MDDTANEGARFALVVAYRRLADQGLLQLSSGNLSVRIADRILITPTGANRELVERDLVEMGMDGTVVGSGVPSSEWAMHAAIYAARPEAVAVVHTHADACTALSCLRKPIPAFHYMIAGFGGDDVPCVPFAQFGSEELAELAAEALRDRTACLLGSHGMICWGRSLDKAADTALKLEMLSRQYILATQAGTPALLSAVELEETRRRYGFYGHSRIPACGAGRNEEALPSSG
jgi:L-fuculose-phosphate aldolase